MPDTNVWELRENNFLQNLVASLPRNPEQLNRFMESDAELIPLHQSLILAVSADSIVEEIDTGLYSDPFLIGWMTVMINLSDLAAVGARPIGLILLQHLPEHLGTEYLEALQRGISEACLATGTSILGGDTNEAKSLQMGATALGLIDDNKTVMRRGCNQGDILFTSAPLGAGNAFAFSQLFGGAQYPFQPLAKLKEGSLIRKYGSACIDTSDGFFPAIANLMDINSMGFEFADGIESLVAGPVRDMAGKAGIPAWFFLAGPHGEFELLFTIPSIKQERFMSEAKAIDWQPVPVARVVSSPTITCMLDGNRQKINPFPIANLFAECGGNPKLYLEKLLNTTLYEK